MAKVPKIDDAVDAGGAFWNPGTPDQQFSGFLQKAPGKRLELTTCPKSGAVPLEEFIAQINGEKKYTPAVLHGFTSQGKSTLLRIQHVATPGLNGLVEGESINWDRYRVSAALFGLHIPDENSSVIDSVRLQFSGITDWLVPPLDVKFDSDSIKISIPNVQPVLVESSLPELEAKISISVSTNLKLGPVGDRRLKGTVEVVVNPITRQSLDWFIDKANRLEHLFSLLLGTSVALRRFAMKHNDGEGWLSLTRHTRIEKPDRQSWIVCTPKELAGWIRHWLSHAENLRPFENLVYGTLRNNKLFVETEFLTLAQALESFHRIAHPQRFTFKERMESLFARVSSLSLRAVLRETPASFEETLRENRDAFTHLGLAKPKAFRDSLDIFLFNQKLHALLRLLLLLDIGVPEERALAPVLYQAHRWS